MIPNIKTLRLILLCTAALVFTSTIFAEEPPAEVKTKVGGMVKRYTIESPNMERQIKIAVVLPPAYFADDTQKFPVIYALHGYGAPYDTYANMSKLHRAQKDMPMIVVCFSCDVGGWYIDSPVKKDSQFMTFFFDELIPYIDGNYRTIAAQDGRAVTGFSMGGFGAINYTLTQPEMFDSTSALSGAFYKFGEPGVKNHKSLPPLLGSAEMYPERYAEMNVYTKIEKHAQAKTELPPIYLHCGTEDYLLESGRTLYKTMNDLGFTIENHESEGGHNWKFWHAAAPDFMEYHWNHFQNK